MVANLCIHFGKLIGQMSDGRSYYSFPSIESLTKKGVDLKLRELKFGYRARFIHDAASYIHKKTDGEGEKWLHSLRERPYEEVHAELVKIPGVGKKVSYFL
jgi:N-glycosylase/DNA lyase